jgi:hypothetical protein
MPDDLLDTNPSEFEITLQGYDFASKKVKLVTQEAELIRSLDKADYKDKTRIQKEITLLEEQIKQMDQERLDAIS